MAEVDPPLREVRVRARHPPPLRAVSGGYQPYKQPTPEDYANDLGYF